MDRLPTTEEIAELLTLAWTETLGAKVHLQSDFFDLGGTSIAAMSIAERVADRYGDCDGIELCALQAVFEHPSLIAMAEELTSFIHEHRTAPAAD